ncbi:hypothetical protein P389DRAFT_148585 [Cystobasidium minutum MCA 4210]|uniref:uncharacterized protein n=1 Tax=Cystobasidium minutum MCA 4210 TaxID=1397322 RepID=UPI0034CD133D|eukprot:jgi/Rhomi1/148585/estExt_Genewise1.C_1_t10300
MGAGQSGPKITAQDKAILDLKIQRDKLRQYQKRVEGVLEREKQAAKEALQSGNKQRALLALRRRKYQESLLTQTDKQLATLQDLVSQIEFSLVEKDVLYGLKQGNSVLTQLNKEMSIENVEKLMSETAEAVAYQKEVDEMLQSRMSAEEEDAVQSELAALEEQLGMVKEPRIDLPSAPRTELPVVENQETEEPATSSRSERVALPA